MGQIALSVPVVGQSDQTEDPKVANDFTVLQTWANGNVDSSNLSSATCQSAAVNQAGQTVKGAVNIAASQGTTSSTYTTLSTPDQVTGVVLPMNGLIAVWYQAIWAESVSGAARAAIFLGSNQLQIQALAGGVRGPQTQAALTDNSPAGFGRPLTTFGGGLIASFDTGGYNSDVTTGQVAGSFYNGASQSQEIGGNPESLNVPQSGPCFIFASAGTYTVSVQFKVASGSVTAVNRKLWVQALSFA